MFPMMADDELDELADDIKINGLFNPIVLDSENVLIDGRNRLEACRRAGVEPAYEQLNGVDPIAFILSSNDKRRHMSKGARAMVAAKIFSLNEKIEDQAKRLKVSVGYVGQAAIVLEYSPELVDSVIAGACTLNDAYANAQKAKEQREDRENEEARRRRQVATLQKNAADLAGLVEETKLSLDEAWAAYKDRLAKEEEAAQARAREKASSTRLFGQAIALFGTGSPEVAAKRIMDDFDPEVMAREWSAVSVETMERALISLRETVKLYKDYVQIQARRNH